MKKLSFLLSLCFLLSCFSFTAYAEELSGTCGENATWTYDTENGTLTFSGTGELDSIVDTELTEYWYDIQKIVINEGITVIPNDMFFDCSGVTSVSLPSTLETIYSFAFGFCDSLKSLHIPQSVNMIEKWAFDNCSSLESITVDENNTTFFSKDNCLIEKKSNKLVLGCMNSVIPNDGTVTIIGDSAFYGCSNLESITIPQSVTVIDDYAFSCCEGLKEIHVPDSVLSIGMFAFDACISLKTVYLGSSVSEIYPYAFTELFDLETFTVSKENKTYHSTDNCLIETESKKLLFSMHGVTFPENEEILSIGTSAFAYRYMETIVIPDSVENIEYEAFFYCPSLKSVTMGKGLATIESYAFYGCSSLESVKFNDSLNYIGNCAFLNCYALNKIKIPASVETIDTRAFGFTDENGRIENFTIEGAKGSAAEEYAKENKFTFVETNNASDEESDFYMDSQSKLMPNVKEKTTVSDVKNALMEFGISVTIKDAEGASISEDSFVGTGYVVTDENGTDYTIVINGDVNGSGEIDATDYLIIKNSFLNNSSLEGVYFTATDSNSDGDIDSTDYLIIKSYFLGK